MAMNQFRHEDYTVGWICALEVELTAARGMLDEEHDDLLSIAEDTNIYTFGQIAKHNIVIACLPEGSTGTSAAASCASNLLRSFPHIRFGLMVGIGGGVPGPLEGDPRRDIRLGDVVVGIPMDDHGGVIQYDFGTLMNDGVFVQKGALNSPPAILRAAVTKLKSNASLKGHRVRQIWEDMLEKYPELDHSCPDTETDCLFQSDYPHIEGEKTCIKCDESSQIKRCTRMKPQEPIIHYGLIGSANCVVRNASRRDQLQKERNFKCFEMEAGGLMNDFPCLVIRGICDYCDSHKNKQWQPYAAGIAAAYSKELLQVIQPARMTSTELAKDMMGEFKKQTTILEATYEKAKSTSDQAVLSRLPFVKGAMFNSFQDIDELDARCLEGTRTELLQEIGIWSEDPSGKLIFWLNGAAGAGKSTISRTVAYELANKGRLGASFFFKRGETGRSDTSKFFSTIVIQLVQSVPDLLPSMQVAVQSDAQIVDKVLREQFEQLLLKPLSSLTAELQNPMVIVVDALDECESDSQIKLLLQELARLRSLSKLVRIFITSRPELAPRDGFEKATRLVFMDVVLHDIEPSIIDRDIRIFLEHRLNRIQKQNRHNLMLGWPGRDTITTLLLLTRPLFICAATICRFLEESHDDPARRLEYLLTSQDSEIYDPLHRTYQPILRRFLEKSTRRQQMQILEVFREVVGAIVILIEPLSAEALATLLSIPQQQIEKQINNLHSVIHFANDEPIRLLHKSFADFLLEQSPALCYDFRIDGQTRHKELALQCLSLLLQTPYLKQDICDFIHPGVKRGKEVCSHVIHNHLPPEVQYACKYWVHHCLAGLLPLIEYEGMIHRFLSTRFLFWFEALGWLDRAHEVITMVTNLIAAVSPYHNSRLTVLLSDIRRFTLVYASIVDQAPLQLYTSCLFFAPLRSEVRFYFKHLLPRWLIGPSPFAEIWGDLRLTLGRHDSSVSKLAYEPKTGSLLASIGEDAVKIWDTTTGKLKHSLKQKAPCGLVFSSDGTILAFAVGTSIILLDPISGTLLQELKGNTVSVVSIALSCDASILASTSGGKTVRLWYLRSEGYKVNNFSCSETIKCIAFSKDDLLLACGSIRGTIDVRYSSTGHLLCVLTSRIRDLSCLAFSSNGTFLAAADFKSIIIWNLGTRVSTQIQVVGFNRPLELRFSCDDKILTAVDCHGSIMVIDVSTNLVLERVRGPEQSSWTAALSPDTNYLALAYGRNGESIKILDINSYLDPINRPSLVDDPMASLACSPTHEVIATASSDGIVTLMEATSRHVIFSSQMQDCLQCLAFSPDGKILAAGSTSLIVIYSVENSSLQEQRIITTDDEEIAGLIFAPDGSTLASWDCFTRVVRLWSRNSWSHLQTIYLFEEITEVHFHTNQRCLIVDGEETCLAPCVNYNPRQTRPKTLLSIDRENWVCWDGLNILWLPPGYAADRRHLEVFGNNLLIGRPSGQIVQLRFVAEALEEIHDKRQAR